MLLTAAGVAAVLLWDDLRGMWPRQRTTRLDEVQFLSSIHAELRAGASLRWALATAADGVDDSTVGEVARLALAGVPLAAIAPHLGGFPQNGRRLAAALQVAAIAGGRSADVFARLAQRGAEENALARERRVLTAQARLSAMVVGGLPVLWLVFGGARRIAALAEAGGVGLLVAVAGLSMELVGGFLVWRLATA